MDLRAMLSYLFRNHLSSTALETEPWVTRNFSRPPAA